MASGTGKIQVAAGTTLTPYVVFRDAVAEAFNTALVAFEPYNTVNLANYAVPLTQQGVASQFYVASAPAGAEHYYTAAVYNQAGIAPAEGDPLIEVIRAVQLADDVPHGGVLGASTATLSLSNVNINAASGDAIRIQTAGGGGFAAAIHVVTTETSGTAIAVETTDTDDGFGLAVFAGRPLLIQSASTTGNAAVAIEAGGGGKAVDISSTDEIAVDIGVFSGGGPGGVGLRVRSAGDNAGLLITSAGTSPAVGIQAMGSGAGLSLGADSGAALDVASLSGYGAHIASNSAVGLFIESSNFFAIDIESGGNHCINMASQSGSCIAMFPSGQPAVYVAGPGGGVPAISIDTGGDPAVVVNGLTSVGADGLNWSDIHSVNTHAVTGNGHPGTEWGPL